MIETAARPETGVERSSVQERARRVLDRIRAAASRGRRPMGCRDRRGPPGSALPEGSASDLRAALDTTHPLPGSCPSFAWGCDGRLPADEKAAVMTEFAAGRIQLLVATTVIEVGVDVPNAALMVIEHAERFGLAQLHQLRGRIGRGGQESVCILLYAEPLSAGARARLKVIFENQDGFEIARQDLLQRGPGEVLGERQSGIPCCASPISRDEPLVGLRARRRSACSRASPIARCGMSNAGCPDGTSCKALRLCLGR